MDDASGGVRVSLMKEKGEVATLLENFAALVKNQFGKNVKIIQSENRLEFRKAPLLMLYSENGILHQTYCVDTP